MLALFAFFHLSLAFASLIPSTNPRLATQHKGSSISAVPFKNYDTFHLQLRLFFKQSPLLSSDTDDSASIIEMDAISQ